jgi:predicted Zn-dependent protease
VNTCADVRLLLDLAPLGLLDDEERATLHAHLPSCAGCRSESTALTAAHTAERRALSSEVEAAPLSPALREKLVQACGGDAPAPAAAPAQEAPAQEVAPPAVEAHRPEVMKLPPAPAFTAVDPVDAAPPFRPNLPIRRQRGRRAPWLLGATAALALAGVGAAAFEWRRRAFEAERLRDEAARLELAVVERADAVDAALARGRRALERGDLADALDGAADALAALDELEALRRLDRGERRAAALVLRARATMARDERDALARAQADLRAVLEQVQPGDLDATRAEGELLLAQGRLDEALERLRDVIERAPDDARAHLLRARALIALESYPDVAPTVNAALERVAASPDLDPLLAELLVLRARAYEALGEADKALQDARAASTASGPGGRLYLGELLMRRGDHLAAGDVFAEAVAVAAPGARVARAAALLEAGFHAEALDDARDALERDPVSLLALVVRAEAEEALLLLDEAARDAEVAALRAPAREWSLQARAERVLARVRATRGDVKAAHDHARRAHHLDEASSVGRLLLATLELDPSFEDQYLDDAESLFKQVLRRHPRSFEARRGAGLVTLAKHARTPERAQRKLEEAYELDPRDPWTMAALARVFEDRGGSDKARALRSRAARFERDPRRPAGFYYLLGVREERRARELVGEGVATHLERARDAFRRALLFDPLHAPAHAGLAAITHSLGSRQATEAHLARALEAHPGSSQALVVSVAHRCARDLRERDPARALAAVTAALSKRGETLELLGLRALLTLHERPDPTAGESVATKAQLGLTRFAELRRRDPWTLAHVQLERDLVAGAARLLPADDALQAVLAAREDALRLEASALATDLGERERTAQHLHERATSLLRSDAALALDAAEHATRFAPWRADGWALLARARAGQRDRWGALAAGLRAAHLDDRHAGALFALLRTAAFDASQDLALVEERLVGIDRSALPFEPDLERLLRAAPLVARSLVVRPEVEVGKKTADLLLELANHDPTRATPQVLLGVLAFGADQEEQAIPALLAVTALCRDAGEAYYLAAVAMTGQRGVAQADLVQAGEWLQAATRAGFDWTAVGREPRLDALRQSPLWGRLAQPR